MNAFAHLQELYTRHFILSIASCKKNEVFAVLHYSAFKKSGFLYEIAIDSDQMPVYNTVRKEQWRSG